MTMAVEPSSRVTGTKSSPSEAELELTGVEFEELASEGVEAVCEESAEGELTVFVELLSAGVLDAGTPATGNATVPDGHPAKEARQVKAESNSRGQAHPGSLPLQPQRSNRTTFVYSEVRNLLMIVTSRRDMSTIGTLQ